MQNRSGYVCFQFCVLFVCGWREDKYINVHARHELTTPLTVGLSFISHNILKILYKPISLLALGWTAYM